MKKILFIILILTFFSGCGKKDEPKYEGIKIEKKTIVNL
tara:strand:- start:1254 stop:1370 length:117 start_codon:yes stop_codon:yes gene_type:complete